MNGIEKIKIAFLTKNKLKKIKEENDVILSRIKVIDTYKNTSNFIKFLYLFSPFYFGGLVWFYLNFKVSNFGFSGHFFVVFFTIISILLLIVILTEGTDRFLSYKRAIKKFKNKGVNDYNKYQEKNSIDIKELSSKEDSILKGLTLEDFKFAIENGELLDEKEFGYLEDLFKNYRKNSFESRSKALKNELKIELEESMGFEMGLKNL